MKKIAIFIAELLCAFLILFVIPYLILLIGYVWGAP